MSSYASVAKRWSAASLTPDQPSTGSATSKPSAKRIEARVKALLSPGVRLGGRDAQVSGLLGINDQPVDRGDCGVGVLRLAAVDVAVHATQGPRARRVVDDRVDPL
jgi:hypothetical protein